MLRRAIAYVRQTWPYFNQSRGSDHLLVMTNDKGNTFMRGAVLSRLYRGLLATYCGLLANLLRTIGCSGIMFKGGKV